MCLTWRFPKNKENKKKIDNETFKQNGVCVGKLSNYDEKIKEIVKLFIRNKSTIIHRYEKLQTIVCICAPVLSPPLSLRRSLSFIRISLLLFVSFEMYDIAEKPQVNGTE